jgi:hypothetical protein
VIGKGGCSDSIALLLTGRKAFFKFVAVCRISVFFLIIQCWVFRSPDHQITRDHPILS